METAIDRYKRAKREQKLELKIAAEDAVNEHGELLKAAGIVV